MVLKLVVLRVHFYVENVSLYILCSLSAVVFLVYVFFPLNLLLSFQFIFHIASLELIKQFAFLLYCLSSSFVVTKLWYCSVRILEMHNIHTTAGRHRLSQMRRPTGKQICLFCFSFCSRWRFTVADCIRTFHIWPVNFVVLWYCFKKPDTLIVFVCAAISLNGLRVPEAP